MQAFRPVTWARHHSPFKAWRKTAIFRRWTSTSVRVPSDMETVNTTDRLAHLRELMKKNEVDIYSMLPVGPARFRITADWPIVVPSEDSHQSEYIAPCDARRGQAPRLRRPLSMLTTHQSISLGSRVLRDVQ